MMRFNIKGDFLDLPANFNIQLKRKNIYYVFDNIEVERSTSFTVPATQNNIAIFGWSNDYHRYGEVMRKKIEAQLQMNGVVKNGVLHVSKFSNDAFECMFVTGELLGLQGIKDLGDWAQFISDSEGVELDSMTRLAMNSADYDAARIEYQTDGYIQPSWLLPYYAAQACANADVNVKWDNIAERLAGMRIVIGSRNGVAETAAKLTRTYLAAETSETPYPTLNGFSIDALVDIFDTQTSEYPIFKYDQNAVQYYGYVTHLVARQDVVLKFDAETSADLFIGYSQQNGTFAFLGDYVLNTDGSTTGDPLAGKEVAITTGQAFVLISKNDLLTGDFGGWEIANETITANVTVAGEDEQPNDAYIRVKDNVPELTIVELLKTIAAVTGTILSYEKGKIVFIDDVANGDLIELNRAIKWDNMSRTFADYAQQNIIQYESDERILSSDRILNIYTIDNKNIAAKNELQTIPFSEGSSFIDYAGRSVAYISSEFEGYTLLNGEKGYSYMTRILLPQNESIAGLLTQSTSISLQVRMTELEFESIKNNTILLFDNASWIWTDIVWNKNVATLSLSKVAYKCTPPPPPYIPSAYQQVRYIDGRYALGVMTEFIPILGTYKASISQQRGNDMLFTSQRPTDTTGERMGVQYFGPNSHNWIVWNRRPNYKIIIQAFEVGLNNIYEMTYKITTELDQYLEIVYNNTSRVGIVSGNSAGIGSEFKLVLFGVKKDGNSRGVILYGAFTIHDLENNLAAEFVPCYRKTDLSVGVYERVSGVFYEVTNATAGPDVTD